MLGEGGGGWGDKEGGWVGLVDMGGGGGGVGVCGLVDKGVCVGGGDKGMWER